MNLHFPIKLAAVAMAGTAVGSIVGQALPHTQISGEWVVDLRTVFAVGFVALGGSWHASKWMTKVNDRLEALEKNVTELCHKISDKL